MLAHLTAREYLISNHFIGGKITAIGAISITKVVALRTINDSMDGKAFEVLIENFLAPKLARGSGSNG